MTSPASNLQPATSDSTLISAEKIRSQKRTIRYIAPLDGVRAIAIIGVLIYHVSPLALRGGFTGVDVFFVLSGFLITSILLHDLRDGRFSLREFYLRRIRRLLPNVVATVLFVLLVWMLLFEPSTARSTAIHGLWTIFNASNIYIWQYLGGYWGESAEWSPLTHTWSLGIEEQFYLLFPTFLLLLARIQLRRVGLWLLVGAILSFGLCVYFTADHAIPAFYLLPTRVWELLLGAVLAAYRTPAGQHQAAPKGPRAVKIQAVFGWLGLAMICAGFLGIDERDQFPGWVSLVPTVGTAILLWSVVDGETRLPRLLGSRPMVGIGKLSYSLYLWHWPLITLGKIEANLHGLPQLAGAIAGGLMGIVMAWMAYVCVEQPLRREGPGRHWRTRVIAGGFAMVALLSTIVATRPRVADPAHRFDTATFSIKLYDIGSSLEPRLASTDKLYDLSLPAVPPRPKDLWRTGGIVHLYGGGHPEVVVLGSSHALMYSRLIDGICKELNVSVAFLGAGSATPAFFETTVNPNFSTLREAREFDEARKKWLREWRPKAVFVIDRWDERARDVEELDSKLRAFLTVVSPLAGKVFFVAQVPVHEFGALNLREKVNFRMGSGNELPTLRPDRKDLFRRQIATDAELRTADFHNLRVLRADLPFYREDGSIRYAEGRNFFYADNDHLTDAGAEVVRSLFRGAILGAQSGEISP